MSVVKVRFSTRSSRVQCKVFLKQLFLAEWHESSNGDIRRDDDSPTANGDDDRQTKDKQVTKALENLSKVSSFFFLIYI